MLPPKLFLAYISYTSFQIQISTGEMLHRRNFMPTQTLKNWREDWRQVLLGRHDEVIKGQPAHHLPSIWHLICNCMGCTCKLADSGFTLLPRHSRPFLPGWTACSP